MAELQHASVPASSRFPGTLQPCIPEDHPLEYVETPPRDVQPPHLSSVDRGISGRVSVAPRQLVSQRSSLQRQARALMSVFVMTGALFGAAALALTMLTPVYLAVAGLSGCGPFVLMGVQLPVQSCAETDSTWQPELDEAATELVLAD